MSVRESMNVISTHSVEILMAHTHVPAILDIVALEGIAVSLSLHYSLAYLPSIHKLTCDDM